MGNLLFLNKDLENKEYYCLKDLDKEFFKKVIKAK